MAGGLKNLFSWSLSREAVFQECRRKYFHRYYLSWGGWETGTNERVRKAYIWSKTTTLPAFVGTKVHEAVASMVRLIRQGLEPVVDEDSISECVSNVLELSRQGKCLIDPKRYPPFEENLFGSGITEEEELMAKRKILDCIRAFQKSSFTSNLKSCLQEIEWLQLDGVRIDGFLLDGVRIYAMPDLAVQIKGIWHVIDWKTGSLPAADVSDQLTCYALGVREQHEIEPDIMRGHICSLYPEFAESRYLFDHNQLDQFAERVRARIQEMRVLVTEKNEAKEEDFEKINDSLSCMHCPFEELCW